MRIAEINKNRLFRNIYYGAINNISRLKLQISFVHFMARQRKAYCISASLKCVQ